MPLFGIFVSTDIWITICVWIHMIAVRTTLQRTFEFLLMYELILWTLIQPTNNGHVNSYLDMNSYNSRLSNLSTDIWIHIKIWIVFMAIHTTYIKYIYIWIHICVWIRMVSVRTTNQLTFEFILMYELILWSFIQLTTKGGMNSYM